MKLSQLRHFVAVCSHNSVTRAAQALHITQPSVSSSIKELELEFGVNLFSRVGRHLSLTKEGEYFLGRAADILAQADTLATHMLEIGNQKNLIRIGVPPMIGTFLFPAMFDAFRLLHPAISIEILEQGSLHTQQLVRNDDLDVAIAIVDEKTDPQFHKLPILRTRLLYCVSRDHPLAGLPAVELGALGREPVILFKADSVQNAVVTEQFARLGLVPNVLLSSSQLYTIKKFVAQGRAGAFLFQEIADMEPDLCGIPLADPIEMDICLIWKKHRFVYSDAVKFIEFTKTYRWQSTLHSSR